MKLFDNSYKSNVDLDQPSLKKNKKGLVLFWTMIILCMLLMLGIYLTRGFSLWFIVSLFLWFSYLYNIKRSIDIRVFSFTKMVIFGVVVLVLSVLIIDAAPAGNNFSILNNFLQK